MILSHGTGARDYQLVREANTQETDDALLADAERLLRARSAGDAVRLLHVAPFRVYDATNSFHDEFQVLRADVLPDEYERIREREAELRSPAHDPTGPRGAARAGSVRCRGG
jgi:hypothetical protein